MLPLKDCRNSNGFYVTLMYEEDGGYVICVHLKKKKEKLNIFYGNQEEAERIFDFVVRVVSLSM